MTEESIECNNFFNALNQIEPEVDHEESVEEKQDNKSNKRNCDNLSPPKNTNKIPKAVRPKIKRDHKKSLEENLEITLSPVFESKFKSKTNKKSELHGDNKNNVTESETELEEKELHDQSCGCHMCFVNTCATENQLSKDTLRNIIQNFIANRKSEGDENLESHIPECLCLDHLKYYRKNKIKILYKILNKQSEEESLDI